MSADLKAVEAVVWTYLDGLHEGDAAKIAKAFHEASHLYSRGEDGSLADLPRAKWLDMIASRPSPKSKGIARTDRIVSIDFAGPESAFVKVECSIHPRYFTDYLALLKLADGWRIVAKSFRTDVRA
ncbi:MAG TPA: nuclear transport factor 2 family protein [Hyphomicrobiaceae bacterium]|nr:nuclear transport factor 2 family protein [Hyphomicrobiaceae bacterium]